MSSTVQTRTAIAMLAAGVALATAGFIVPPTGEIADSVLLFTAQCFVYAGSALGINVYIDQRLAQLQKQ